MALSLLCTTRRVSSSVRAIRWLTSIRVRTARLSCRRKGALERDENLLAQAQMDLERYRAAWARNAIAKQILDDQEKLVLQDEGHSEERPGNRAI